MRGSGKTQKHAVTQARNKQTCNLAGFGAPTADTTTGTLMKTPQTNAGPTRARNPFPNISSGTERGSPRNKVGNGGVHFS